MTTSLTAKIEKETIIVSFSFNNSADFYAMVDYVKNFQGRRFNSAKKIWEIPYSKDSVEKLKDVGFSIQEIQKEEKSKTNETKSISVKLKKKLKDYQKTGVGFIEKTQGRALIADEMGLGKTIQAIAYLELHPELRPAIIICPASVKFVWEREIQETMLVQQDLEILSGRNGNKVPLSNKNNIVIINYDIVNSRLPELLTCKPKIVILDESHYIKDPSAQRTKAIQELCANIPHIICLSGTPITNRPIEFFPTLNLINPYLFPNRFKFALKYCDARKNRFGWDMSGASNLEELNQILVKTIMIRRKKEDVLTELPPKTRTSIPLEIDNKREYQEIESDVIQWIMNNEGSEAAAKATRAEYIVQLEKLKQASAKGKLKSTIAWIENFIDSGEKLIIFCTHKAILDTLQEKFPTISVRLDGSTSQKEREIAVNKFQTDKNCKLFIGNIKAAGVGITLTAASNIAFLEFDWTPGNHLQAEDRAHRIGQRENVFVYYLTGKDTIDEKLAQILKRKSEILGQILDGVSPDKNDMFNEVLDGLKS